MRSGIVIGAACAIAGALAAQPKAGRDCDRACLEPFVDRYLDAVVAHDPAKAPLAKGAKFTENGQRLEFGEGLWNTMTGQGAYRLFVADVEAGQVAFLGSIQEAGTPAMIALRWLAMPSPCSRSRARSTSVRSSGVWTAPCASMRSVTS